MLYKFIVFFAIKQVKNKFCSDVRTTRILLRMLK